MGRKNKVSVYFESNLIFLHFLLKQINYQTCSEADYILYQNEREDFRFGNGGHRHIVHRGLITINLHHSCSPWDSSVCDKGPTF